VKETIIKKERRKKKSLTAAYQKMQGNDQVTEKMKWFPGSIVKIPA
jgi:hypothetical protein